jgi:hypothetical protein
MGFPAISGTVRSYINGKEGEGVHLSYAGRAARKACLESKKQAYERELTIGTAVEAPGAMAMY